MPNYCQKLFREPLPHLRKCQREREYGGRFLPFANTTPRPNWKRLKHILLICGEFGVCILEPAFGLVKLRLNEVIGLAVCRFLWDAEASLERTLGKGLVFFSSRFNGDCYEVMEVKGLIGSGVLTPIGINWPQTTASGRSTSRGGVARACGGWRRSASKMTAWR